MVPPCECTYRLWFSGDSDACVGISFSGPARPSEVRGTLLVVRCACYEIITSAETRKDAGSISEHWCVCSIVALGSYKTWGTVSTKKLCFCWWASGWVSDECCSGIWPADNSFIKDTLLIKALTLTGFFLSLPAEKPFRLGVWPVSLIGCGMHCFKSWFRCTEGAGTAQLLCARFFLLFYFGVFSPASGCLNVRLCATSDFAGSAGISYTGRETTFLAALSAMSTGFMGLNWNCWVLSSPEAAMG